MFAQVLSSYSTFMNAHKVAGTIITISGIAGVTYIGVETVKTLGQIGEKIIECGTPISISNGHVSVSLNANQLDNTSMQNTIIPKQHTDPTL